MSFEVPEHIKLVHELWSSLGHDPPADFTDVCPRCGSSRGAFWVYRNAKDLNMDGTDNFRTCNELIAESIHES